MKRFVLAAFVLLSGLCAAHAATIDGTWKIDGDVSGNAVVTTCILAEKDGKVTGTCTRADGKQAQVTGTVTETAIKWAYESTYQGGAITLSYTAKQDKDGHMVGSIDVPQYSASGDFTAKREAGTP